MSSYRTEKKHIRDLKISGGIGGRQSTEGLYWGDDCSSLLYKVHKGTKISFDSGHSNSGDRMAATADIRVTTQQHKAC